MYFVWWRRIVLVLGIAVFVLLGRSAQAMEVRPPILEVSARAGESTGGVFLLKNTELVEKTYVFRIQGFVPQGDQGQQVFLPPTDTQGLPSWLYLRTPRVTLAPGATVAVPFLFRPPQGVGAGGYQAVIFVEPVNPRQMEGVVLGRRIGVLVFATVEGDVRRSLLISSFQRVSPRWSASFSPRFEAVLRNGGEAHEVPSGRVMIKNVFGQIKESFSLQSAERVARILPRSERRFFLASTRRHAWIDGWGVGWYRAELLLDEPFIARADAGWFFVLPWKSAGVLGGIIFLGIFIRKRRR